jgi:hypothetical protein
VPRWALPPPPKSLPRRHRLLNHPWSGQPVSIHSAGVMRLPIDGLHAGLTEASQPVLRPRSSAELSGRSSAMAIPKNGIFALPSSRFRDGTLVFQMCTEGGFRLGVL